MANSPNSWLKDMFTTFQGCFRSLWVSISVNSETVFISDFYHDHTGPHTDRQFLERIRAMPLCQIFSALLMILDPFPAAVFDLFLLGMCLCQHPRDICISTQILCQLFPSLGLFSVFILWTSCCLSSMLNCAWREISLCTEGGIRAH